MAGSALTVAQVQAVLKLKDQATEPLNRFEGKLGTFTKKGALMASTLAAGGALVAGSIIKAGQAYANFEGKLNAVKAVTGATSEEMELLKEQALEMGAKTKFSASEAAEGMEFLGRAGFSANQILTALPSTLNLAAAGKIGLAEASDIASNVLATFNMEVSQLPEVVDTLAAAAASSNTNVSQLGQALKFVGPVSIAAGIGLQETTAAIGVLSDRGFQGEMAGTALRGAITKLLNPSNKAAEILERLGITVETSSGKMLPLVDIVGQFEKSGLSAADAMEIFGQRAGPGMLNLVSAGSEAIEELKTKLEESEGAAQKMADTMQEGLHGAFTRLRSAADTNLTKVGDKFSDYLIPIVNTLVESVNAVGDAFDNSGEKGSESAQEAMDMWRRFWDYQKEVVEQHKADIAGLTVEEFRLREEAAKKAIELRKRIAIADKKAWGVWKEAVEKAKKETDNLTDSTDESIAASRRAEESAARLEKEFEKITEEIKEAARHMKLFPMDVITSIGIMEGEFGKLGPTLFSAMEPGMKQTGFDAARVFIDNFVTAGYSEAQAEKLWDQWFGGEAAAAEKGISMGEVFAEESYKKIFNILQTSFASGDIDSAIVGLRDTMIGLLAAAGPWGQAASFVANAFFGIFDRRSKESRKKQQEAHQERMRQFKEQQEAYKKMLADMSSETIDLGFIGEELEEMFRKIPDYIPTDGIRDAIQSGLDELDYLGGLQGDLEGFLGHLQELQGPTEWEKFISGEGDITQQMVDELNFGEQNEERRIQNEENLRVLGELKEEQKLHTQWMEKARAGDQEALDAMKKFYGMESATNDQILAHTATRTLFLQKEIPRISRILEGVVKTALDRIRIAIERAESGIVEAISKLGRAMTPTGGTGSTGSEEGDENNPLHNAMGGNVKAGQYSWVGEKGPELVRFNSPGTVFPNGASPPINITVISEIDGEEIARANAKYTDKLGDSEGW